MSKYSLQLNFQDQIFLDNSLGLDLLLDGSYGNIIAVTKKNIFNINKDHHIDWSLNIEKLHLWQILLIQDKLILFTNNSILVINERNGQLESKLNENKNPMVGAIKKREWFCLCN